MRWCQSLDSLEGVVAAALAVIKELVKAAVAPAVLWAAAAPAVIEELLKAAVAPAVPEGHVGGAAACGGVWLAKRMRPIWRPDIVGGEVGKWIRQL